MRCNNCGGDHFLSTEYVMPAAGLRLAVPQCTDCGVFALGTTQLDLGEEERLALRRRAATSVPTWRPSSPTVRELRATRV